MPQPQAQGWPSSTSQAPAITPLDDVFGDMTWSAPLSVGTILTLLSSLGLPVLPLKEGHSFVQQILMVLTAMQTMPFHC